jgi:FkbM family methyltransferase
MSDNIRNPIYMLTGRQRLIDRIAEIERRLDGLDQRFARFERRLEEAIAYLGIRANRILDSQAIYLGDHTAVTFLQGGLRILVDTRSLDIGIHLLTLGQWETAYTTLFTRLLRPGHTVLDIGANHGVYALMAAQLVGPTGCVHAFEPNPRLAYLLDMSLRLNGFAGWARSHCLAVSDQEGTARIFLTDTFSGGASLAGSERQRDASGETRHAIECRLVVLDQMFADPAFRVDVIKMDVEGHEGRALRGMRGLLARSPDVKLMMEFGPEMLAGSGVGPVEVVDFLRGLGLSAWRIGQDGGILPAAWDELAAEQSGLQNILVAREAPF